MGSRPLLVGSSVGGGCQESSWRPHLDVGAHALGPVSRHPQDVPSSSQAR